MMRTPPENTLMLLESRDIYDGWSAALLSDGSIVNRWDKELEKTQHFQTIQLIAQFLAQQEDKGFEDEPE